MPAVVAIAVALGQGIPEKLQDEAEKSWSEGGFRAVALVLLLGIIAIGIAARWFIKRADERAEKADARADKEREANTKSADALMNLAEKAVEAATKGEAATREQTGAISAVGARNEAAIARSEAAFNALAQEVRARGGSRGPAEG